MNLTNFAKKMSVQSFMRHRFLRGIQKTNYTNLYYLLLLRTLNVSLPRRMMYTPL